MYVYIYKMNNVTRRIKNIFMRFINKPVKSLLTRNALFPHRQPVCWCCGIRRLHPCSQNSCGYLMPA